MSDSTIGREQTDVQQARHPGWRAANQLLRELPWHKHLLPDNARPPDRGGLLENSATISREFNSFEVSLEYATMRDDPGRNAKKYSLWSSSRNSNPDFWQTIRRETKGTIRMVVGELQNVRLVEKGRLRYENFGIFVELIQSKCFYISEEIPCQFCQRGKVQISSIKFPGPRGPASSGSVQLPTSHHGYISLRRWMAEW